MLLTQFPNIHWLRAQANANFSDQHGVDNTPLPEKGWPNVILNTESGPTERRDIKGPFSLFLNIRGNSKVQAEGKVLSVTEDTFGITNFGQHYDLIIPADRSVTTFNVHFGEQLYFETLQSVLTTQQYQLDNFSHDNQEGLNFFTRTHFRSREFNRIITRLKDLYRRPQPREEQGEDEEILLSELLIHLIRQGERDRAGLKNIRSLKRSTQDELMKRLLLAVDYIHDNYHHEVSIDQLSRICCLSKFHFLRTFKEAFGCTPGQYWRSLRLQKAEELLEKTSWPVNDIALAVGFAEVNSFIRFFTQRQGKSPTSFRKERISNFG